MNAPIHEDELSRLGALKALNILDTAPEERFDRMTRLAKTLLDMPIALISLVDEHRQWFKSRQGLEACETSRAVAFCTHAIRQDETMVVADTQKDARFANNPLVKGPPYIRFYAGHPICDPTGHRVGTLCVVDTRPRKLTKAKRDHLRDLAQMVNRELAYHDIVEETRKRLVVENKLQALNRELEAQVQARTIDLLSANQRLENLLASVRCLIWQAEVTVKPDSEQGVLDWQMRVIDEDAAQHFLPLNVEEGQTYTEAWGKSKFVEDQKRMDQTSLKSMRSGMSSYSQEFRCRQSDGQVRWLYEVVQVNKRGEGVWDLVGVCTDITDRKWAEESLQKTNAQNKAVIANAPIGIVAFEPGGSIVSTNPAFEKILGYARAVYWGDGDMVFPEDLEKWKAAFCGAMERQNTQMQGLAIRLINKDGHTIWANVRFSAITNAKGDVVQVVALVEDITEARALQEHMQQQDRLSAVGQLAAGIAHDFNNMLTVITGTAQMLGLRSDLSEQVARDIRDIHAEGQKAAQLVRQILDFSRKTVSQTVVLELAGFMKEGLRLLKTTMPANIEMDTQVSPGCHVEINPTQMQQVLTNLVVNARDAMPNGGQIRIDLSLLKQPPQYLVDMQSGPCVMMRVSDTGEGMPDDVIEHIFEPFFSTKPTDKGTGLGLSQVYGIVKQYGGEILVESRINKGTHFTIYWPLAKKQIEKKETIKDTQTFGEDATILLVEDQPSVRRVVEKILGSLGYRVLCANDGLEALSVYESGKSEIDLVLSDIVMPGMNGQTLVESLPDVPFILMTGYPLNAVDQKLPTNVKGFMLKPVERNKVAQAVFEALGADAKGV